MFVTHLRLQNPSVCQTETNVFSVARPFTVYSVLSWIRDDLNFSLITLFADY